MNVQWRHSCSARMSVILNYRTGMTTASAWSLLSAIIQSMQSCSQSEAQWRVSLVGTGLPFSFQIYIGATTLQVYDCECVR